MSGQDLTFDVDGNSANGYLASTDYLDGHRPGYLFPCYGSNGRWAASEESSGTIPRLSSSIP